MQVIKTVALQAANNTGQRIREQAAWFYLRHMNIDKDTSPSTAFHALLTRKERESLPAPQGEKEKAVRSQLCTRSALFEAQLYDKCIHKAVHHEHRRYSHRSAVQAKF